MNKERIVEELRKVAITTLYLYVCFGAILLYRMAVLHAQGVEFAPWGIAVLKALVLGKFVLIGRAAKLGQRYTDKPLIYPVLYQSVLFVIMLIVLSLAEETIRGFFHGDDFIATITDLGGWLQIFAVTLLLWLVMLPYLGMIRLSEMMGKEQLRQLILGERRGSMARPPVAG